MKETVLTPSSNAPAVTGMAETVTTGIGAKRLQIRWFDPEDVPAIERFNERLARGGIDEFQMPLDPRLDGEIRRDGERLPRGMGEMNASGPIHRRMLIAEEGGEIRGGILLFRSAVSVLGEERSFCWAQLPLSEGLVDPRYSTTAIYLVKRALAEQPFLMGLGVGSLDAPWAKLMRRLGWSHATVPFLFCPLNAKRVLRELPSLRQNPRKRRIADLLAGSGLAGLIGPGMALKRRQVKTVPYQYSQEETFGEWADVLYHSACARYGATVRRDAATLNLLYAPHDPRYQKLRVRRQGSGEDLGWILVIRAQMEENKHFGNLCVGTLADGFGSPESAPALIDAGIRHLADQGVDLLVTNWSHEAWVDATRRVGFLSGPSNYFFFVSPEGKPLLEESCPLDAIHMTRGDCDGPGHLVPRRESGSPSP